MVFLRLVGRDALDGLTSYWLWPNRYIVAKLLRSGFNVTMLDIGALPSKDDAVLKKMLKEQFDQMSARQNLWKKS